MRKVLRRAVVTTALFGSLVLGAGTAAAAPQTTITPVPVVTGFQIAPGAVPGGLFQTIPIRTTVGAEPGVVTISAANVAAWDPQYPYRFLTVHWRNLATGATGSEGLRHWELSDYEKPPYDPAIPNANVPNLSTGEGFPTEVVAKTGAGPVAIVVTHSREYFGPPNLDTLIPGVGVVLVP